MRTTINLDEDVAAAVDRLRRQRSIGLSQAVNELLRQGLQTRPSTEPFQQRTNRMGARIDVSNVGKVLELLDEGSGRG